MSTIEIFILALLQGLTEFLPISSSAHLILPSQILGWQDQGIGFDVSVHVGTLLAVVLYFRKDIGVMAVAWLGTMGLGPEKKTIEL
jgi:undecaprenyl-diphosphatase